MKYSLNPEKRLKAILESPTYRLAQEDLELLNQNDLRPVRLQLELLKPERVLREQGIQSTVVVFGSARIVDAASAKAQLDALDPLSSGQELARGHRRVGQAFYYEQARRFAELTKRSTQRRASSRLLNPDEGHPGRYFRVRNRDSENALSLLTRGRL